MKIREPYFLEYKNETNKLYYFSSKDNSNICYLTHPAFLILFEEDCIIEGKKSRHISSHSCTIDHDMLNPIDLLPELGKDIKNNYFVFLFHEDQFFAMPIPKENCKVI
jgi:hypothetical protein